MNRDPNIKEAEEPVKYCTIHPQEPVIKPWGYELCPECHYATMIAVNDHDYAKDEAKIDEFVGVAEEDKGDL